MGPRAHAEDDEDMNAEHGKDQVKERMEKLRAEASANFLKQLPANVRRRVHGLKGVQKEYTEVHEKFLDEMRELERRYESLYAPHYDKRRQIVQGIIEPTEEEISKGSKVMEIKDDDDEPKADESAPKGIPDFWLNALKNNEMVDDIIVQRDEACLKHLTDITSKNFDDPTKGFTLTFHFDENPFFTNSVLTKTYHLAEDDEILIEKCEGCTINWHPGQDLTVNIKQKKQRQKGGKNTRVVTKSEPCDSFFNFFNPPKMPEDDDDDEDMDEEALDEIEEKIEHDYEVGRSIKDRVIPRAVDWFTGEAITTMEFAMGGDSGGAEEDEDDDVGAPGRQIAGGPGQTQPPECKQQ
jgi:nucleosome assembly protein 1-like 1